MRAEKRTSKAIVSRRSRVALEVADVRHWAPRNRAGPAAPDAAKEPSHQRARSWPAEFRCKPETNPRREPDGLERARQTAGGLAGRGRLTGPAARSRHCRRANPTPGRTTRRRRARTAIDG